MRCSLFKCDDLSHGSEPVLFDLNPLPLCPFSLCIAAGHPFCKGNPGEHPEQDPKEQKLQESDVGERCEEKVEDVASSALDLSNVQKEKSPTHKSQVRRDFICF